MRERPRATFIALRARRRAYRVASDILYDPPIRKVEPVNPPEVPEYDELWPMRCEAPRKVNWMQQSLVWLLLITAALMAGGALLIVLHLAVK